MPRLDLRVDCGVPGWIADDGSHVRLQDTATPEGIAEHRRAITLLTLSLAKLQWELDQANGADAQLRLVQPEAA